MPDAAGRAWKLKADHPLVMDPDGVCPYCENRFKAGDVITLRALPPTNKEDREKAAAGHPYTAPAVPIHVECVAALG